MSWQVWRYNERSRQVKKGVRGGRSTGAQKQVCIGNNEIDVNYLVARLKLDLWWISLNLQLSGTPLLFHSCWFVNAFTSKLSITTSSQLLICRWLLLHALIVTSQYPITLDSLRKKTRQQGNRNKKIQYFWWDTYLSQKYGANYS